MASDRFRAAIVGNIREQIGIANSIGSEPHPGTKGSVRENCVKKLVDPVLRGGVTAVTNGHVIDSQNRQSGQIDVVVYSDLILPRVFYDRPDYVPLESSLYLIEVKSQTTKEEVRDALRKARTIRDLSMERGLWGFPNVGKAPHYVARGKPVYYSDNLQIAGQSPRFVLFAFDSDLTGVNELDRLLNTYSEMGLTEFDLYYPLICAICVVGKGYWYHIGGTMNWWFSPASDEFDEVIDLLGGIANTTPEIIFSRGAPRLGPYIMVNRSGGKEITVSRAIQHDSNSSHPGEKGRRDDPGAESEGANG